MDSAKPLNPLRALIVEDSAADMELMLRSLEAGGFAPAHERVEDAEGMRRMLERQAWDVVLSDYALPRFGALAALAVLEAHGADIPFIVVSGSVGEDVAQAAMLAGATAYVMKDRLAGLAAAVTRALGDARARRLGAKGPPAPALTPAPKQATILIAEDEPLVRLLTRKVLEQAGYRVLVAASGAEAIEIAAPLTTTLDLLLTDVVMPQMSGRELAHRLAVLRPGLRVLYMTGYSDEAVARHGVLDPGTALIQKPFTPAALAARVREVLIGESS
jgi:CheY-like chemotaxis protein